MLQTDMQNTQNSQTSIQVLDGDLVSNKISFDPRNVTSGCIIPNMMTTGGTTNVGLGQLIDQLTIPNPAVYPLNQQIVWTGGLVGFGAQPVVSPWRVKVTDEELTVSIDIPGVKLSDLSVVVDQAVMKMSGKRFDNGTPVFQTYIVPVTYDPTSSSAVLEAGVLTVQFSRAKDQVLHKIAVKGVK